MVEGGIQKVLVGFWLGCVGRCPPAKRNVHRGIRHGTQPHPLHRVLGVLHKALGVGGVGIRYGIQPHPLHRVLGVIPSVLGVGGVGYAMEYSQTRYTGY